MDDSYNLDTVARELNNQEASGADDVGLTDRLDHWLAALVNRHGSDLLLVEGAPPCIRVDGEVRKIEAAVLDGAEIEASVLPALSAHALRRFREAAIADSSYRLQGLGRFRINLHRERSRAAAAIRAPERAGLRNLCLDRTAAGAITHFWRGAAVSCAPGVPAAGGQIAVLVDMQIRAVNEDNFASRVRGPVHRRSIAPALGSAQPKHGALSTDTPDASLRAGRKLASAPEIAGMISHNTW